MKTEHLAKAYKSVETVLDELGAARKENPSHSALIFDLVEEALRLDAKIFVILTAAAHAGATANLKGTK